MIVVPSEVAFYFIMEDLYTKLIVDNKIIKLERRMGRKKTYRFCLGKDFTSVIMVLPMESMKPLLAWRSSKDRAHTHTCGGEG